MEPDHAAILLRASARSDPPSSLARYIRSLSALDQENLLSSLLTIRSPANLLRALWPARVLHPRIFQAIIVAAVSRQQDADALLGEAETLIGKDAIEGIGGTRGLAVGCGLLLEDTACAANTVTVARLVVAFAKGARRYNGAVNGDLADAMVAGLLQWVRRSANVDVGRLAEVLLVVLGEDGVEIGLGIEEEVREAVANFVHKARGTEAADVPAIFRCVLWKAGRQSADRARKWAPLALKVVRTCSRRVVADVLSVLEWQLTETPFIFERFLQIYEARGTPTCTARDLGTLLALSRCANGENFHSRVRLFLQRFVTDPLVYIDAKAVAADSDNGGGSSRGGSSTAIPEPESTRLLRSVLQDGVAMAGMELRCGSLIELADSLVCLAAGTLDSSSRQHARLVNRSSDETESWAASAIWGSRLLVLVFLRHEHAREPILDSCFRGLVEGSVGEMVQARAAYRDALDQCVRHPAAPAMFRPLLPKLKHWLGFLSSMTHTDAIHLVTTFSPLAVTMPLFGDFFLLTLRKLSSMRSPNAQAVASAGLVALISDPGLEHEAAECVVELTGALFSSGSIRVRANLLGRLTSRFGGMDAGRLRDSRLNALHSVVSARILQLIDRSSSRLDPSVCTESCPLQLNACFEVSCGEPALRDAIPELVNYILVMRRVDAGMNSLFLSTLQHISDFRRVIRDVATDHREKNLNPKWVYVKSRLLMYLCELHLNLDDELVDRAAIFRTYAVAVAIRDGLQGKLRISASARLAMHSLPGSAVLERVFARDGDVAGGHMTAREARAIAKLSAGRPLKSFETLGRFAQSGVTPSGEAQRGIELELDTVGAILMSMRRLVTSLEDVPACFVEDKRGLLVVACELCSALPTALQKSALSKSGRLDARSWEQVAPLVVSLLCVSQPWATVDDEDRTQSGVSIASFVAPASGTGERSIVRTRSEVREAQSSELLARDVLFDVSTPSLPLGSLASGRQSAVGVPASVADTSADAASSRRTTSEATRTEVDADHSATESERPHAVRVSASGKTNRGQHRKPTNCRGVFGAAAAVSGDIETRGALERIGSSKTSVVRYRVLLRYYVLQILLLGARTDFCAPVWDNFIASVSVGDNSGDCMHETMSPAVLGTPEASGRKERVAYAMLSCFEREFEYSMSTSLSVAYIDVIGVILAVLKESDSSAYSAYNCAVLGVLQRIFSTYTITHPTVLRPMFYMLLSSLDLKCSISVVEIVFDWLGATAVRGFDVSPADEEEKVAYGDRFDDDIVAEAMDIDNSSGTDDAREGVVEGTGDSREARHRDRPGPGEALRGGSMGRSRVADPDPNLSNLPSRGAVQAMSLMESEECRSTSLLVCVSFLESLLPSRRGTAVDVSDSNRWVEADVETTRRLCDLFNSALFGVDKSSGNSSGKLSPRCLPPQVVSKLVSLASGLVGLGRQAVRFFKSSASADEAGSAEYAKAASVITVLLSKISEALRIDEKQSPVLLSNGRLRFALEQFEVELAASVSVRPKSKWLQKAFLEVCTAIECYNSAICRRRRQSLAKDSGLNTPRSLAGRKRRRVRSRNKVVDEWLQDERGTDNYADMEDFLVDADVVDGL